MMTSSEFADVTLTVSSHFSRLLKRLYVVVGVKLEAGITVVTVIRDESLEQ